MAHLNRLLTAGLATTTELWAGIRPAHAWVHRAAHLLSTVAGGDVFALCRAYRALLAEMRRGQDELGTLNEAVPHLLTVTTSYWPGVFRCYTTAGVPRTHNDLATT